MPNILLSPNEQSQEQSSSSNEMSNNTQFTKTCPLDHGGKNKIKGRAVSLPRSSLKFLFSQVQSEHTSNATQGLNPVQLFQLSSSSNQQRSLGLHTSACTLTPPNLEAIFFMIENVVIDKRGQTILVPDISTSPTRHNIDKIHITKPRKTLSLFWYKIKSL